MLTSLNDGSATKVLIFGNSGSGKSTLAKQLSERHGLAHLDLDVIAWQPGQPPLRKSLAESQLDIEAFCTAHKNWVIEGCYADLLGLAMPQASAVIYLDLSVAQCQHNARQRPWEPHKYASKAQQDANLAMLVDWIAGYEQRDDEFSRPAHLALFKQFGGEKHRLTALAEGFAGE